MLPTMSINDEAAAIVIKDTKENDAKLEVTFISYNCIVFTFFVFAFLSFFLSFFLSLLSILCLSLLRLIC